MSAIAPSIAADGPYYEDLHVGLVLDQAPAMTLTEGHAAVHQAILGDRLRLALDADLCRRVAGKSRLLAHPALVCDVAIGQSTLVTQRVIANLFYRGLVLRRAPELGDTVYTRTEVVALRDTSPKPNRRPTGLVALRIRTVDQLGRDVLDFYRCAMLPMRSEAARPGHHDDLDAIQAELSTEALTSSVEGWDLAAYRERVPWEHIRPEAGQCYAAEVGDTVSGATELARLSLNIAAAHHIPAATGQGKRLVYGGHTIGLAFSHLTRAFPDLLTVVAWRSCDHLAPVYEGDVLYSSVTVESIESLNDDAMLVDVIVETSAERADSARELVLRWRPAVILVR